MSDLKLPIWLSPQGDILDCKEKIKILNENLIEIHNLAQDAFEDTILMGGDEKQFKLIMEQIISNLNNPYNKTI